MDVGKGCEQDAEALLGLTGMEAIRVTQEQLPSPLDYKPRAAIKSPLD
ncbi:hypothetical protein PALI_a3592 [Pseudoalteromonas aliena SW19]|uniref:Uncharacterized protein n=1 Tax=Pseudoalteromonas aliena SW19 TaxID=1314866 RepID=A0ABR9DWP6_9GAMM|nr:hypothetical protein [Pseudoalteromonas aliena SW19]